ncbi:SDR family oxidoreductase [Allosphingosinicella deserti]|uniref:Short-chain dehydrogenase n=1 Tax=Allosphingosinicella deserti TaxID=2116704 RepID=A0A2P7QRA7_9SPHN|nr:SDR family oxidoreductase [Sphingomonas deserti]PSJ40501.1 short-chain dehydrogenase [Sphingomonas deserti]
MISVPIRAIVTGASRGIGRAIALELASSGAHLALVARRKEPLDMVAEEVSALGGFARTFPCDLTRTGTLADLVERIAAALGGIDTLINNAGAFDLTPVGEADLDRWDHVLDLNLRAVIHLSRHALPHLQRNSCSTIVNVASVAGKDYLAKGGIYGASKFGLFGFAGALFEDVRNQGVKVCTIAPGQVAAARIDGAPPHPSAAVPAGDIARVVAFVIGFPATSCPTEIVLRAQHRA